MYLREPTGADHLSVLSYLQLYALVPTNRRRGLRPAALMLKRSGSETYRAAPPLGPGPTSTSARPY